MRKLTAAVVGALLALGLALPAAAAGSGPPLGVPRAKLASALHCHGDLAGASRDPVLLVPGTTLTPDVNFDWNYEPALAARGLPYCTVRLPGHAMANIENSAKYVVYALRRMHAAARRAVDVVGFSQGGMLGRWALKFWPDTRADVDDMVGIDPSNHGTLDAYPVCVPGCAPAFWQQQTGSHFIKTLNAGQETYAGISYTQIYSIDDEVVVPNLPPVASSSLHTGPGKVSNVAVQGICPIHVADHLMMGSIDPVAYALVIDAITHEGPADPSRIDRGVCTKALMPGVNPVALPVNEARYIGEVATTLATYPHTFAEPPLQPYAR